MLSSLTTRHWLICAISMMASGIVIGIAGCIIAAVGFGLSAKDMYDYPNLAMRCIGMVLVGFSILPLSVCGCCWYFYCSSKREDKKGSANPKAFVINTQDAIPMAQYPYSTSAVTDTRIYKPQQPPRHGNVDADDSLAPLNFSDASSRYPADTSSPQVVTSASSFDDDQTASKVRRPKKGKKGRQEVTDAASEKEKEAMMSAESSRSYRT